MIINIDENAKVALKELLGGSNDEYIRIKVAAACGSTYYELYTDFKREDDISKEFLGIPFVFDNLSTKACENITIKYDKEIYNNGFYIKENK